VCALTRRLAVAAGGPEGLEALGTAIFEVPELTPLVRILRLVSGPRALYWASFRWGGPRMFPHLRDTFAEPDERTVVITTTIPEPHADCPEFFHLVAGFYRALPRNLRLPDAEVALEVTPRHAVYRITLPPALTLWSRIRHAFRVVTSSTSAIEELAAQHGRLQLEYAAATEARDGARRAHDAAERARVEAEQARDDAERARAVAERERALAERALKVKSEFLAIITHELRTPLNGLLGMAALLEETEIDDEQATYLDGVLVSGRTLLTLINDVLDFSRLDAGGVRLAAAAFDPRELAQQAIQVVSRKAEEKGVTLTCAVAPEVPAAVVGDAFRVLQLLTNLAGNAVKFTARGSVAVRVEATPARAGAAALRFSVEDTGIGIAPAARAHIFEAFTQADSSTTRSYGGAGLGLGICKQLVDLMGGELGVESTPGAGSTFWFTLTLPTAAAVEQAA
jgi:signal transduction histidine kinase